MARLSDPRPTAPEVADPGTRVRADGPTDPAPPPAATAGPGDLTEPGAAAEVAAAPTRLRPWDPRAVWALIRGTLARAWADRVLGLAAEAGFWQLLSLPPLVLAVFGTIGWFTGVLGPDALASIERTLLRLGGEVLAPSAVEGVLQPVVEEVLRTGRPDVVSIGFLLSLWSGSTAMATFVNTISIAYDQRDGRSAVRSRLVALWLYLGAVVSGVIVLPLIVLGPELLGRLVPETVDLVRAFVTFGYWPTVLVVSVTGLTALYHLAVPRRQPWRRAVPGAVVAVVLWVIGSFLLRVYLDLVFGNAVVYGALSAPIAALLFLWVFALGVLLGAELNAELDRMWPTRSSSRRPAGVRPPYRPRWRRP